MHNFTFYNPVNIVFGQGTIEKLKHLVPAEARIMLLYGGGSIKKNGVYEQIRDALKGFAWYEFGGIEPNPEYETCLRAAAAVNEQKCDFLLAVGGGSVIDATKFISVAALYPPGREPWEITRNRVPVKQALPFGTVLTLPATGSEMNDVGVISRAATEQKLSFSTPLCFPRFSILDPATTLTLPTQQVVNGVIDTFAHTMEQYMSALGKAPLTERLAEGLLITLIEAGTRVMEQPECYDTRATLMWCATIALNGLLACGMERGDWASHAMGHELTARYGIDHALTLAVVMPAVHRYQIDRKINRLVQCAERVWQITDGSDRERAIACIEKMEQFFRSLGARTRLSEYGIDVEEAAEFVATRVAERKPLVGEFQDLDFDALRSIMRIAGNIAPTQKSQ